MEIQYQAVYGHLRRRIESGEWPVGERIPSIAQLQNEYQVPSLNTVRAAQQMLVEDGMLETRQGVGAFVIAATAQPRPSTGPVPNLGVRFEFIVNDAIEGVLAREDLQSVGIPRAGECIGRGALSSLVHEVVGLDVEIARVDHYPIIAGCGRTPLAIAVIRVDRTYDYAAASTTALQQEGWHPHDMRRRLQEASR